MQYGKMGTLALPATGLVLAHSVLLAMTLITIGIVAWQLVPRIRRHRARR
jgi:hypothetical protein